MLVSPENAVYHRLVSSPLVASIVGFNIFPVAVPKGAGFPFLVYRKANTRREHSLRGRSSCQRWASRSPPGR
jgi:hypothetical protein